MDRKNKQIESSVEVALSIQQAFLPSQGKLQELLKDYFIIYRPKDVVSGDFYWINKSGDRIMLIAADCTGHGVPGAFMTLIGTNLLDKIVRVWKVVNPGDILSHLHQEILKVLRQKETNNHNGMDMVVLSLEKNAEETNIIFSGAKNNLFYAIAGENTIEMLKGSRKSVGGIQNEEIDYENQTLTLPSGSKIYTGSDGLEDQNDKKRRRFGRKNLMSVLENISDKPMKEQKTLLEEALEIHMSATNQRDDILWMGIQL